MSSKKSIKRENFRSVAVIGDLFKVAISFDKLFSLYLYFERFFSSSPFASEEEPYFNLFNLSNTNVNQFPKPYYLIRQEMFEKNKVIR